MHVTSKKNNLFIKEEEKISINILSKKEIYPNYKNIDAHWMLHLHHCVPRPKKDEKLDTRIKTPWAFPISFWSRQYNYLEKGEGEEEYFQAFEYDFNRCNFNKDFRGENGRELMEAKSYLWNLYKKIYLTYKYISSFSGLSIWQIQQSSILELMNKANNFFENYAKDFLLLKVETVKMADNDERKKKNKNIPDNLVRHQFLNFFVKASIDKYINNRRFYFYFS